MKNTFQGIEQSLSNFTFTFNWYPIGENISVLPSFNHTFTIRNNQMKSLGSLFSILYVIVFVVGVTANLVNLGLRLFTKSKGISIDVYTTNLSISDILILLVYVPTQIVYVKDHGEWRMGLLMCKMLNSLLPIALSCTICILLAIAGDRLWAVLRPMDWKVYSHRTSKRILPIIWVLSVAPNIPLIIYPKLIQGSDSSSQVCSEGWSDMKDRNIFWTSMFVCAFCIPLIALLVFCVCMVYLQKKQANFLKNQPGVNTAAHQKVSVKKIENRNMNICFLPVFDW